ncbi:MAG: hypothetical protein JJU29_13095 [Verrucomicrobia bacterium]|nr:hypothetical protein [Verrucomicrobiota bacterium]
MELLKKKKLRKGFGVPMEVLGSFGKTAFDDCTWHDPRPLLAETLCYAKGFVGSGGNTNPD